MRAYQLPKGGAGIDALTCSTGRCRNRCTGKCWSKSPPARSISATTASCAAATACRCGKMSIPLSDGAGEVVEIGPGVRGSKPATRSPAASSSAGLPASLVRTCTRLRSAAVSTACSPNTWCWRRTVSSNFRQHLSLEEGATLPCAAVTAWHAMILHARLIAGQTVLLARHRRRFDLRPAIRARDGHHADHHLVER